MEEAKKLPNAVKLEKAVLGAALAFGASGELIEIFGREKVFYDPVHQAIYDAIISLYEKNQGIDLLTVNAQLEESKKLESVGGTAVLVELSQSVSSGAHLEYHARIIQQAYVKRKAIEVGRKITDESYKAETDIFNILEGSYRELDQVSDWLLVKKPTDFKSTVDKLFEAANNDSVGVPSSLDVLQRKLNGYQKTNLLILAARPGMGKTALMINEALHAARQGIPVGIFSLEMSERELAARMMANYCKIDSNRMSLSQQTPEELQTMIQAREDFSKLPIYIHDQPAISPLELKIQASKWKREKGVEMIFVDYLQLMRLKSHRGNREQEVSECSAALKGIAKELDVPVMSLAQLSRSVETRGGSKRPILSDLRDSGAIEQDADIVMFLYRPEYYGIDEWDDGKPTANQAEITIAKFRNGKPGFCIVGTNLQYMQFLDHDETETITEYQPGAPNPNFDLKNAFEPQHQDDPLPF